MWPSERAVRRSPTGEQHPNQDDHSHEAPPHHPLAPLPTRHPRRHTRAASRPAVTVDGTGRSVVGVDRRGSG